MAGEVQEKITYGGVTFDRSQIEHMSSVTENNVTKYSVWLNDGTKLTYENTAVDRNAIVKQIELKNGQTRTEFYGLSKAEIEDTEKDDVYFLMGCQFTTVNANRKNGGFVKKSADKDHIMHTDRELDNGKTQVSNYNRFNIGDNESVQNNSSGHNNRTERN